MAQPSSKDASGSARSDPLDLERITKLTRRLADEGIIALYAPDDHTLVLAVEEMSASAALVTAVNRVQSIARSTGAPPWHLVRAEVVGTYIPQDSDTADRSRSRSR